MNTAHWHLVLNHLPIVGTYLSLLVLFVGILIRNQNIKNTGLGLFILAALMAIPAFLTGEGAEDVLESAGQASKQFIEAHEEMAEKAFWICEALGVLSLIALFTSIKSMKIARTMSLIVFVAGILASALWIRVGNSGGEIRHTEIRTGNPNAVDSLPGLKEDDDDDD